MPHNNLSKENYLIALFLGLLAFGVCTLQISDGHNWRGDFAAYISQAIALMQGSVDEYVAQNALMMDKSDWVVGPHSAPWGFPLMLAPIYKIFGFNLWAFKCLTMALYALFVGVFYLFCIKRLPKIYAIFATLFFALNPHLTLFSASEIVCDIPFLLVSFIALVILAKLFEKSPTNNGIFIAIIGGIFLLFATLIRFNGIIILCALLAMHGILALKRIFPSSFKIRARFVSSVESPYSWYIHAIPYIIFALGFALISFVLSSGTSGYMREFEGVSLAQSIIKNLHNYGVLCFGAFFGNSIVLFALCIPLILLGIATNPRDSMHDSTANFGGDSSDSTASTRDSTISRNLSDSTISAESLFFIIFWLGFFAHLVLWPPLQSLRYAYPLLPFMVFFGVCGLKRLCGFKRILGRIMALLCVVILVNNALLTLRQFLIIHSDISVDNAYNANARDLYRFIRANTPKDALIISFRPRVIHLNTARWGFATNNIERIKEADFVLWSEGYDFYKMPSVESSAFQQRTELIYQNAQFKLFRVIK